MTTNDGAEGSGKTCEGCGAPREGNRCGSCGLMVDQFERPPADPAATAIATATLLEELRKPAEE